MNRGSLAAAREQWKYFGFVHRDNDWTFVLYSRLLFESQEPRGREVLGSVYASLGCAACCCPRSPEREEDTGQEYDRRPRALVTSAHIQICHAAVRVGAPHGGGFFCCGSSGRTHAAKCKK